ncbi:MAG: hypothetical protein J1E56_00270 [Ruminococcus sp.]|nr:hypothetical protein [Ruminococcus sp.]
MKKLICLFLTISMLFLFVSCNQSEDTGNSQSEKKVYTASADEAGYPYPIVQNWEESNNATGARFDMTLKEYTEKFNEMYNSLGGGSQQIDFSQWQLQSEGQLDENGVAYDYYYYADDMVVLTATVEQDTDKIMNLGCGTTVSVFINEENAQYQTVILAMTGIMACVAGNYPVDNVTFFSNLFVDTITENNNSFWYNNCIYLLNVEEGETDDESTMLFRIVAASDNIEKDWNLVNYKTYKEEDTTPQILQEETTIPVLEVQQETETSSAEETTQETN